MAEIPELPTGEELRLLPRSSMVAFAARCARRVQPLYRIDYGHNARVQIAAIWKAIWVAEENARGIIDPDAAHKAYRKALAAAEIAHDVDAKSAAFAAAYAATNADIANKNDAADAASQAADAEVHADITIAKAETSNSSNYPPPASSFYAQRASEIRNDFDQLLKLAKFHGWNDEEKVDHWRSLGPLWVTDTQNLPQMTVQKISVPDWFQQGMDWQEEILGIGLYNAKGWPHPFPSELEELLQEEQSESEETVRDLEKPDPAPLVLADFEGNFTAEEIADCLEYLSEVYKSVGGPGLKVVESRELQPESSEVCQ